MKAISQFITDNYQSLANSARRYANGDTILSEELLHETCLVLLENKDPELINRLITEGVGMNYACRVMSNMTTQSRNDFYKRELDYKFKKSGSPESITFNLDELTTDTENELNEFSERSLSESLSAEKMACIQKVMGSKRFFYREVFKLYYGENYSFTKLANDTGISRKTLYNAISGLKKEINEHFNKSMDLKKIINEFRVTPEDYAKRIEACGACIHFIEKTGTCGTLVLGGKVEHNDQEVKLCGCVMSLKARLRGSTCPVERWEKDEISEHEDQFLSDARRLVRKLKRVIEKTGGLSQGEISLLAEFHSVTHGSKPRKSSNCAPCIKNNLTALERWVEQRTPKK